MSLRPESLPESALAFLRERHLATLTRRDADGRRKITECLPAEAQLVQ